MELKYIKCHNVEFVLARNSAYEPCPDPQDPDQKGHSTDGKSFLSNLSSSSRFIVYRVLKQNLLMNIFFTTHRLQETDHHADS